MVACVRFVPISTRERETAMSAFNQPIDSSVMPRCSQPATLTRLPFVDSARGLDITLYGVPFDYTKNQ